jgi:hypothetical protein
MTTFVSGPTIVCSTAAALTAAPNASMLSGSLAYVVTFGAYWVLQATGPAPDAATVLAAADGRVWVRALSGVQESSQAQTAWFVDRQNSTGVASDENTGLSSAAPLLHKAEIVRRWGTPSPNLNAVNVLITYLSADTDNSDPGLFSPFFSAGATLKHIAALPAAGFTGSLLAVTAKNRAGNLALRSTFTTTTGAVAINMLLVNATRGNSRAFAQRNTGAGLWQISQPFAPYTGTGNPPNTEVDTWANGDAITGYALQNIDLALIGGQVVEYQAGFVIPSHIVQQLTIWDPQVGAFDPCVLAGQATGLLIEAVSLRATTCGGTQTLRWQLSNVSLNVEFIASGAGPVAEGPIIAGGILNGIFLADSPTLQGDTIVASTSTVFSNTLFNGPLFYDTGVVARLLGSCGGASGNPQYGVGKFNLVQGVMSYSGAAATLFALSGGLQINGATNAYSNATAAGLTTTHLVALTPANIDAAAGAAGFGGLAYVPGVGAFQQSGATP